ncbi:spore germination protein [Paenibacillus ginsengarvi]|uniref:Spore germination protein n=2 Tax=Paenibacillus ginsengarvi TaxID=400777 RepID=A0A3B0CQ86_9BACL|nr:spore germination protein [Paenibacillus ginsengarvi]
MTLSALLQRRAKRMQTMMDNRFEQEVTALEQFPLTADLDANLGAIRSTFGDSDDLVVRRFFVAQGELEAAIVYFDGLSDNETVNENIMAPLMSANRLPVRSDRSLSVNEWLEKSGIPIGESSRTDRLNEIIRSVLSGDSALLLGGVNTAILLNTKGWERRGIDEPRTESVVRGPRDGFTETLCVNTALIRRRLKDPNLRIRHITVGRRTNTDIAVAYVEGIANSQIVDEVMDRLQSIEIDAALESGYLEQLIEDSHWTPFPLIQNTERPDKATANLLEGKLVIICDGTPFALIAPAVFSQFYHSPEDYYERFLIGTLIRLIRVLSMIMALLLPSLYIAFSSFHPEMIPSRLVIAMAAGRSTVPFPSIIEAFLMEVTMEILREASVRLPGPIGPTIGIVGALVVGQAAVQAGIVSPIMVIIVALTTIGSFAAPSYSAAIALRMLRFPMMAAAAMFGLYGIMLLLILIIIHLCSLKSFGVPYLSPLTPSRFGDLKDAFIRAPLFWMKNRPSFMKTEDKRRISTESGKEEVGQQNGEQRESNERNK